MRIIINILKFISIIIGSTLFILLMIYLPQKLLEDKIPKSEIDEGKYILNLLAEEYEKLLSERRELLRRETERLLSEKGITKTLLEKRRIEQRLREIELQRKILNQEYNESLNERREIEKTVSNLQKDLESSGKQIISLNEKYLNLSVEKEKQELYWEKFINDIKEYLKSKYSENTRKTNEIERGFTKDNGREYICEEIDVLNNSILRLQNQVQLQRENINSLKTSSFDSSKENKKLKVKLEDYEKLLANYEKYAEFIKNFDKIKIHFDLAKKYFNNKNYSYSANEYKKVISEISQINESYSDLLKIQKELDNEKASDLYDKALNNIKNKRYNFALTQLQTIIRDIPNSDYTTNALRSILSITNQISDKDKIKAHNDGARALISKGDNKYRSKEYKEALDLYYDVILDYQYSIYIEQAIKKVINTNQKIMQNKIDNFSEELRDTFLTEYELYNEYYEKGYYEKARNYYFTVLSKMFGEYSNNTIMSFKKFEDRYIELLIDNYKSELEARL